MHVNQKNWQELIRPTKLDIQPGRERRKVATMVAEPLERGFGTTLGNALRRILLSSLQGAAVSSVQIDGVLHEFSSIAGVREDVTDIVLNIKEIALAMHAEGPKRVSLRKEGPGVVRAGDIQQTADIHVLNPEHVICTLDEGAEVRMEFTVNTGKGYVSSERNRPEDAPIGLIPVDSIYSPVRRVSYKIENTREGQILDYDKLIMTVETDGSMTPEDAVAYAARILQDQLNIFVNFDPANMILYGAGEPIPALEKLGSWVHSIHCKDATWSDQPGETWGRETPLGDGDVNFTAFIQTLKKIGYTGPLTIEREIPQEPERQKAEIGSAIELLERLKQQIM